jgi:hypothetical protein
MQTLALFLVISLAALSGCVTLPDLEDGVTAQAAAADYPLLRPQDELLADADASESDQASERADLAARVAALQTRAVNLQSDVLGAAEKDRLTPGQP